MPLSSFTMNNGKEVIRKIKGRLLWGFTLSTTIYIFVHCCPLWRNFSQIEIQYCVHLSNKKPDKHEYIVFLVLYMMVCMAKKILTAWNKSTGEQMRKPLQSLVSYCWDWPCSVQLVIIAHSDHHQSITISRPLNRLLRPCKPAIRDIKPVTHGKCL